MLTPRPLLKLQTRPPEPHSSERKLSTWSTLPPRTHSPGGFLALFGSALSLLLGPHTRSWWHCAFCSQAWDGGETQQPCYVGAAPLVMNAHVPLMPTCTSYYGSYSQSLHNILSLLVTL